MNGTRRLVHATSCAVCAAVCIAASAHPPQATIPVDASITVNSSLPWGSVIACDDGYAVTRASQASMLAEIYRRTENGWQLWQELPLFGTSGSMTSVRMRGGRLCCIDAPSSGPWFLRVFKLVDGFFEHEQSIQMPTGDSWKKLDFDGGRIVMLSKSGSITVRSFVQDQSGNWITEGESLLLAASGGLTICMDGDMLAIGRPSHAYGDVSSAGAVFIAKRDERTGTYAMVQTIAPPGVQRGLGFGTCVSIANGRLFVGAPGRSDGLGVDRGLVYRYEESAEHVWLLDGTMAPPRIEPLSRFGADLWSDGTRLAVATKPELLLPPAPRVWTFARMESGTWVAGPAIVPSTPPTIDSFGYRTLASDGHALVIGESRDMSGPVRRLHFVGEMFDCDGNGITDALEIESGVVDCDGNRRPDSCDSDSRVVAFGCDDDCDADGVPDWQELQLRLDFDCDGNGVPDSCDLAMGSATDLDGNGVPDSCDPDCDGDGIIDALELAGGSEVDCDANALPDVCPHYRSGVDQDEVFAWYLSGFQSPSHAYVIQRFETLAGRESIDRVDFVLKGESGNCDQSYQPIRVAIYRELSETGEMPIEAELIWFVDTFSGPEGEWSSIAVPHVIGGEPGQGFFVVLVRTVTQGCAYLAGAGNYCSVQPAQGCGHAWYWAAPGAGEPPMAGVISSAWTATNAWSMRVWGAACAQADLNHDGLVDGDDLGAMLGEWGYNPGSLADLNDDQFVNGDDLGILLGAWT